VRTQFAASIDYALETVGSFAARRAGEGTLMVVLGDHEPATFVSEMEESFDVPVHLIGSPDLVAHAAAWGWTPGLLPAPDAPVWPMAAFRDRFLAAFTPGAPDPAPGGIGTQASPEDRSG
jgi:hypothetical protein